MTRLAIALFIASLFVQPIDAAWRAEGPFAGAIVDVAIDPSNPDIIYAAAGSGGVWRSDDGGKSWTLPGDDVVNRPVKWIEVDPKTPATLWAGIDYPGRTGLWRSTDRGKTWAAVRPEGMPFTPQILGQPIAFAPSNPSIIYAPSTNLHYRSSDGGKTWEYFRVEGQDAYAFAIDPKNPKIIYAGGRGSEHQMRRSSDGGKTWQPVGEGLPERSIKLLAIPRERPETVYVSAGFGELFKTEDGGKSWKALDIGLQGTDDLFSLDLDPHDANTLLAGTENGLRRSTDGGETWETVGGGLGNWFVKGVAFHPKKKGTVFAGTTGKGFFISSDGGESFEPSSEGLGAGWVKKIYAPANGAGPIFAQLSVGLYRQDGPGAWTEIRVPFEEAGILFDTQSPKRVFASKGARWWRSEDSGRSWKEVEVPQPGMRDMMRGKMDTPSFDGLAQDPANPSIFYAGGTTVYRTTNAGKKWEPAGTGIAGNITLLRAAAPGVVFAVAGKEGVYRTSDGGKSWTSIRPGEINDLAVDPKTPARVYVATEKGLYRTADNGATWSKAPGIKRDEVEAVVVSPSDGKVFAATFDGVFVSADGGDTWKAMNDGLLNADVRALAIAGGPSPRLYAGVAAGSVHSMELP